MNYDDSAEFQTGCHTVGMFNSLIASICLQHPEILLSHTADFDNSMFISIIKKIHIMRVSRCGSKRTERHAGTWFCKDIRRSAKSPGRRKANFS